MLSFFSPRDVFDEIWDLNESVSEGFPNLLLFNVHRYFSFKILKSLNFDSYFDKRLLNMR